MFNIFLFLLNVILLRQIARENLVNVEITDTYDFNRPETGDEIGSALTTIAYYAHEFGLGIDFPITITYTMTFNKRYGIGFG